MVWTDISNPLRAATAQLGTSAIGRLHNSNQNNRNTNADSHHAESGTSEPVCGGLTAAKFESGDHIARTMFSISSNKSRISPSSCKKNLFGTTTANDGEWFANGNGAYGSGGPSATSAPTGHAGTRFSVTNANDDTTLCSSPSDGEKCAPSQAAELLTLMLGSTNSARSRTEDTNSLLSGLRRLQDSVEDESTTVDPDEYYFRRRRSCSSDITDNMGNVSRRGSVATIIEGFGSEFDLNCSHNNMQCDAPGYPKIINPSPTRPTTGSSPAGNGPRRGRGKSRRGNIINLPPPLPPNVTVSPNPLVNGKRVIPRYLPYEKPGLAADGLIAGGDILTAMAQARKFAPILPRGNGTPPLPNPEHQAPPPAEPSTADADVNTTPSKIPIPQWQRMSQPAVSVAAKEHAPRRSRCNTEPIAIPRLEMGTGRFAPIAPNNRGTITPPITNSLSCETTHRVYSMSAVDLSSSLPLSAAPSNGSFSSAPASLVNNCPKPVKARGFSNVCTTSTTPVLPFVSASNNVPDVAARENAFQRIDSISSFGSDTFVADSSIIGSEIPENDGFPVCDGMTDAFSGISDFDVQLLNMCTNIPPVSSSGPLGISTNESHSLEAILRILDDLEAQINMTIPASSVADLPFLGNGMPNVQLLMPGNQVMMRFSEWAIEDAVPIFGDDGGVGKMVEKFIHEMQQKRNPLQVRGF
eukprot:comp5602_c1_seq1/m.1507 comp5602_c1_seq1/g.1507  ORF comp5602_c1_seq1/g.1507 comp5602_c1_seq1/m.1507 type:complete len:695 (-) comp5602_c1_seq1:117-2201(-)